MEFYQERKCSKCGNTSYIFKQEYPAPDGYDHDCSCPYCDNRFFTISKTSRLDYIARKTK